MPKEVRNDYRISKTFLGRLMDMFEDFLDVFRRIIKNNAPLSNNNIDEDMDNGKKVKS